MMIRPFSLDYYFGDCLFLDVTRSLKTQVVHNRCTFMFRGGWVGEKQTESATRIINSNPWGSRDTTYIYFFHIHELLRPKPGPPPTPDPILCQFVFEKARPSGAFVPFLIYVDVLE